MKRDAGRIDPLLGGPGDIDQPPEALGVRRRLVPHEVVGEALDQLVERLGLRRHGDAGGAGDTVGVDGPAPAPAERRHVASDGDAVQLDGPLDLRRVDRDGAVLHRHTEQHDVGRRGVAEQAGGDGRRVDVAVVVAA